ncbi:MAG: hypothetical protein HXX20_00305 [Chloroflexi bacterium]|nr:hypothetical protein [Chloroflexota bacterium]
MEYTVIKIGEDIFDSLHACGLGILLATAGDTQVKIEDMGTYYRIYFGKNTLEQTGLEILNNVLALPTQDEVLKFGKDQTQFSVALANFDGLLSALFTTRGPRLASVRDVISKQKLSTTSVEDSLSKVIKFKNKLLNFAAQKAKAPSILMIDILLDYSSINPKIPSLNVKSGINNLNVLMTVAPAFSYSTRQPRSDGLVTHKTNISIAGTRYATLLAFVGAARFLRTQRVSGNLVNYYVPLANQITLEVNTTLPLLFPTEIASVQAIIAQALSYATDKRQSSDVAWKKLSYQTLQTQGALQSISVDRGCFDLDWLTLIGKQAGDKILSHWKSLLYKKRESIIFEIDNLLDCLKSQRLDNWLTHLYEMSNLTLGVDKIRPYSFSEVKEISLMMSDAKDSLLTEIFGREKGTVRFGHALRLLGRYNFASLRDLTDALDCVQTRDQLLRSLAQLAQECTIASAKSQFIIVPDDEDLRQLLVDVEQNTARTIALLLIILASLRYPQVSNSEPNDTQASNSELVSSNAN